MTIEELQQQVLDLQDQLTEVTNERDTLRETSETLERDLGVARNLNQKLFERVKQQDEPQQPKEDEPESDTSIEDFAKSISKIV